MLELFNIKNNDNFPSLSPADLTAVKHSTEMVLFYSLISLSHSVNTNYCSGVMFGIHSAWFEVVVKFSEHDVFMYIDRLRLT